MVPKNTQRGNLETRTVLLQWEHQKHPKFDKNPHKAENLERTFRLERVFCEPKASKMIAVPFDQKNFQQCWTAPEKLYLLNLKFNMKALQVQHDKIVEINLFSNLRCIFFHRISKSNKEKSNSTVQF